MYRVQVLSRGRSQVADADKTSRWGRGKEGALTSTSSPPPWLAKPLSRDVAAAGRVPVRRAAQPATDASRDEGSLIAILLAEMAPLL